MLRAWHEPYPSSNCSTGLCGHHKQPVAVCRKEMGMSEALPFSTTGGHENQGTDMNDGEPTVTYLGSFQASQ